MGGIAIGIKSKAVSAQATRQQAGEPANDRSHNVTPEALDDLLLTLTEASARQALNALEGLPYRESDVDQDRGARSVESLVRVSSAASTLRTKLQKDAADHAERAREGDVAGGREGAAAEEAARLADFFDAELQRRRTNAEATPTDGGGA
ncbi:MAG: hypothetical protein AAF668_01445 [Pseudomonadota bacterium]